MNTNLAVSLLALKKIDDLDNFLKILKNEKIQFLELPITKIFSNFNYNKKKLNSLNNILNKYSLKISSVQAIFYGQEELNIFNKKKHNKIILHIKKVIKITKFFKAKNLIFGSPINRKINIQAKSKQIKNGEIILQKIIKLCEKNNLFFCIEPNAKHYGCNYINTINQALNLVKKIPSKNFLINADTGNISLEEKKFLNYKKQKKYFGNFQISEKNLVSLTKGKVNHVKILNCFDVKNKIISLEMNKIDINIFQSQIKKFKKIIKNIS